MPGFSNDQPLLQKLGRHRLGKSCLYLKSIDDIDLQVLQELLARSYADMREKYS